MLKNANHLLFTGEKEAHVFFSADVPGQQISVKMNGTAEFAFTDACGTVLTTDEVLTVPQAGIYRLWLKEKKTSAELELWTSEGVIPFLMPGVGLVWDHGDFFPLALAGNEAHSVWALHDPAFSGDGGYKMCVIRGVPYGEEITVTPAEGEAEFFGWYPKLNRAWFWHSAEIRSCAKWLRFDLPKGKDSARVTVWNCNTLALQEPNREIPCGTVLLTAEDESGNTLDARFEFFVGEERVAMYDVMREEAPEVHLPVGCYTLRVSHGICYNTVEKQILVGNEPVRDCIVLKKTLQLPRGWALGELHTHSGFEDATAFPRQTMRAARANGRNFCFQTDKEIETLLQYGVHHCDLPGEFIGLPGQEIMCHEVHMNVLNTDRPIANPEADFLDTPNCDAEQKIANWIRQVQEIQKDRPCLLMHNHPSHRTELMETGRPYFRSWWVSDRFDGFDLVENFDYRRWFDRLNRNHILYGAWTGDGHDCSLAYPGKEGVCVFVGDELSAESVVSALKQGHFFSTRAPGAFVSLNVGEAKMGDHIAPEARKNKVQIEVRATRPIEKVELVAGGEIVQETQPGEAYGLQVEWEIPENARWILARVKLKESGWDVRKHSFTPLMCAGYDAFTNPIFFDLETNK